LISIESGQWTMKYVYLIESESYPARHYTGSTVDLRRRMSDHNSGQSAHTSKYMPWKLAAYFAFADAHKADRFETYLKSGSGRAFIRRHF